MITTNYSCRINGMIITNPYYIPARQFLDSL